MRIAPCAAALACFFASHAFATDLPRVFLTSTSGTGNLSSWPDAHGMTGLDAADEICRTRADAVALAESDQYIALLSDTHDDAYCRLHGDHGKRASNCNQAEFPVGAGPWYRMDDLAALDVAQNFTGDDSTPGYVPRHILYDELGNALDPTDESTSFAFTATRADGSLDGNGTCADWSSENGDIALASPFYGFGFLGGTAWTCDQTLHLVCMEKGVHGPALTRSKAPSARVVFVTSSTGSGDLSSWPDAGAATSTSAGDAICSAHAARAGLSMPETFKAWLSTSAGDAIDRFANDGTWFRTDGVRFSGSIAGLVSGLRESPPQLDENGAILRTVESTWTGTGADGRSTGNTCLDWTSADNSAFGAIGQSLAANSLWTKTAFLNPGCASGLYHLYCFGDNDSLFLANFD